MSTYRYTRGYILDRAGELASRLGLTGLTIGQLAHQLQRPKSTVYFHFGAKTQLQIAVLENAAREFVRDVIGPACEAPAGLARLERLFEQWLIWDRQGVYPGGCLFVTAASEFDDRPGPVRDRLLRLYQRWMSLLRAQLGAAIAAGVVRPGTDPAQALQELHGIMLSFHLSVHLLRDAGAERHARQAFASLMHRITTEDEPPGSPPMAA